MAPSSPEGRIPWSVWLGLGVLLAIGAAVEFSDRFAGTRAAFRSTSIDLAQVDNPRLLNAFQDMGLLQAQPQTDHGRPTIRYGLVPSGDQAPLPSTGDLQDLERPELTTVALRLDQDDLDHPAYGILTHPHETGRAWERLAAISIWNRGSVQLENVVGLRVHGGISRRLEHKSLRVYWRRHYGTPTASSTVLFEGIERQMSKLVLHNDERWGKRLSNPVGYALGTMAGLAAPRARPIRLIVNGQTSPNLYVATEHMSSLWVTQLLGHEHHLTLDARENRRMHLGLRSLYGSVIDSPAPLDLDWVEDRFDLDNFMRWMALNMFISNYDRFQGLLVRDDFDDERWSSYLWDLDRGFDGDEYFDDVEKFADRRYTRYHLWDRLTAENPEFNRRFAAVTCDLINWIWTRAAIETMSAELSAIYGPYHEEAEPQLERHRTYLLGRRQGLCEAACSLAGVPAVALRVEGAEQLDGHRLDGTWLGWHPAGTSHRIEAAPGGTWLVDGLPRGPSAQALELELAEDCEISVSR